MKNVINLIFSATALLIIGYYFGSINNNNKQITSSNNKPVIINNVENSNKNVISYNNNKGDKNVKFEVKVIAASLNRDNVDPELKELKKAFDSVTPFSEFTLLKQEIFETKVGSQHKIVLPNKKFLYFIPKNISDSSLLGLNIRIPWILNINLKVKNGEGFFQGGLRYNDQFIILYIKPIF